MIIYLYIKTHNKTGLKYFGKTTRDPFKYTGSGKYWKKHLDKHGIDISTEIYGIYTDAYKCSIDALEFSKNNNIAKDAAWANLQEENGLDGKPLGAAPHIFTDSEKQKISNKMKLIWANSEYREKLSSVHKQRWTEEMRTYYSNMMREEKWTTERKIEHGLKLKGKTLSIEHKKKLSKPKPESHKINVSNAMKGKQKTESHKKNLSKSAKNKTIYVTRLKDKKLMRLTEFNKWVKDVNRQSLKEKG